jgi:hypothetical protein
VSRVARSYKCYMRHKRVRDVQRRSKLKCPECQKVLTSSPGLRDSRFPEHAFRPQAGELTECYFCRILLEYSEIDNCLSLRRAPQCRVNEWAKLEPIRLPSLSELVEAARKRKPIAVRPKSQE